MQPGLNNTVSAGRCGTFNGYAAQALGLNTCQAVGEMLWTLGENPTPIGMPDTGNSFSRKAIKNGWTGRSDEVKTDDVTWRVDLRTTLPGPLYSIAGLEWGFDWSVISSPLSLMNLPGDAAVPAWEGIKDIAPVCLIQTKTIPVLMITDTLIEKLTITSHEHWHFTFARPNARIMLVPLLDAADAPQSDSLCNIWQQLLELPPLNCIETFENTEDAVKIHAAYSDSNGRAASLAPLPAPLPLLGTENGLIALPEYTELMQTHWGPYAVCSGDQTQWTVAMDWAKAIAVPGRTVEEWDEPLPYELAYAGDASWDESTPMDQLLSWRIWGQLHSALPDSAWQALRQRLQLPTVKAFRDTLGVYIEQVTGRKWMKEKALFDHCGEVSYDTDWYNGLTLSGLRRAYQCGDQEISQQAESLIRALKLDRAGMCAYYSIFCDWQTGAAWTDARGITLNLDCAHNGLEGILAEADFCDMENDSEGHDFAWYLAARSAPIYIASMLLPAYKKMDDEGKPYFGFNGMGECLTKSMISAQSRAPYNLAGDFPEFAALLHRYGPREQLQLQADTYKKEYPERYSDWLAFYVGTEKAAAIRTHTDEMGFTQEAREQASVFYHVAPDTALRLWVLGQDPDEVERLYTEAMPAACCLLCRAGYRLEIPE